MKFDPQVFKDKNRREYQDSHGAMNWLCEKEVLDATRRRDELLGAIYNSASTIARWEFANTKPFTRELSPGCLLCGQGLWSCLFVNNLCNANCFYCPSAQKDRAIPGTGNLEFEHPEDYVDYLDAFNIRGVSFSGGEPTLSLDRVMVFLKTLRQRELIPRYIWMYTNGILITKDKLKALRDGGLDEIRFDIGADRYNLDKVRMAVGIIPRVTVEIPAIPEDLELLKTVVSDLANMGVNFLNLHQLRCTKFNMDKFIKRNYTFLHGPGVTVLETEFAALEIMKYTLEEKIELAVNYCSFTYRNQFQGAGGRRRNAIIIKKAYEDITQTGYIRSMALAGSPETISAIKEKLILSGCDPALWHVSGKGDRLFFGRALWDQMDFSGGMLSITYFNTSLRQAISYRHSFKEVVLNKEKKVMIERMAEQGEILMEGEMIQQFFHGFVREPAVPGKSGLPASMAEVADYEHFRHGLMEYF